MEQEMYRIPLWQHASDMAALDKAAYKSLFLFICFKIWDFLTIFY